MIDYKRIAKLRMDAEKTQAEIGQYLGEGQDYYQKRECGRYAFSAKEMKQLADYYGVTVDELYLKG